MLSRWAAPLCCLLLAGCAIVEIGVTNPVQGLTTVAVAPFFNLSQEKTVDGRRFALAYFAELQKVPGFEVIPVGIVEQAIRDHQLEMNNPADVLRLAQLLDVDAVVVGGVTDYAPYYPPRLGMQVSWYSPRPWNFYPGIPLGEPAPAGLERLKLWKGKGNRSCDEVVFRAQSDWVSLPMLPAANSEHRSADITAVPAGPPEATIPPPIPAFPPIPATGPSLAISGFDPQLPLMTYTRMFDGSDARLVARLRDYVALSGDLRSGGWEAYLHRSEDFIRFTAHVMVVEMLQLHGGEVRRRFVFTLRK